VYIDLSNTLPLLNSFILIVLSRYLSFNTVLYCFVHIFLSILHYFLFSPPAYSYTFDLLSPISNMPGPNLVKPNPDNQPVSLVSIPESSYIAELAEKAYEKGSTALLRLKASARVRDVVLRPEKQAKDIVWNRIANHEAILGHTRGILQDRPCKTCEQMIGPFADCVAVTGEFLGSCTNCHYNSCGKRCSFRLPAHTPGCKYLQIPVSL